MADKGYTIVLKRSPDYKIYVGQTVYGGPVSDGSGILMNICVDHFAFPNYIVHPLSEDGKSVDVKTVQDQAQIGNAEREILCGVYLTLGQAKRTATWLTNLIETIERGKQDE